MKESIRTQSQSSGAETIPSVGFFLLLLAALLPSTGVAQPFGDGRAVTASADGAEALAAADLDGDGDQDVLAALRGSDAVAWYANDGTGTFGPARVLTDTADAAADVGAADLDQDGDVDVVVAAGGSGRVTWYENDGTGAFSFGGVVTEAAPGVRSVDVADLDGDGRRDILAAASGADRVSWYPNNAGDTFGAGQVITDTAEGAFSVVADTLTGDAVPDVAVASYSDNTVSVFQNDGTGTFTAGTVTTRAQQARTVRAGDVDDDGNLDLVVASSADSTVAWYPGRGDGTFGTEQVITASADAPYDVHLTDTDGDGALDVAVAAAGSDRVLWYGNDGTGAFGSSEILDRSASIVHAVHAAPLDDDARPDVLAASSFDDAVFWYENNPPPSAPSAVQSTRGNGAVRLGWAPNPEPDLDGYNVYRSTSSFSSVFSATQVNAVLVGDTTFVDTSVTNGTSYFYRLAAVDTSGQQGGLSSEVSATPTAGIRFVDADASGANDGSSWTDAHASLQDALAAARPTTEVWVAEGTYYPDEGSTVAAGDTTASFTLPDSVEVYGGFAGTENARTDRAPGQHPTVLSGDVNQDGSARSNHVVTAPSGVTRHARLDGVIVRGGRGATNGGGIFVDGGGLSVARTVIVNNKSTFGGGLGAASADTVVVSHTRFVGNAAVDYGGGLSFDGVRLRVLNSVVTGNTSTDALQIGGGLFLDTGDVEINGTTLSGNRAGGDGGGIYAQTGGAVTITNSILWADSSGSGADELYIAGTEPTVRHSLVEGTGGSGASWVDSLGTDGGGNLDAPPHFVDRTGPDGRVGTRDDNLRLADHSPALGAGDGALLPADVLDLDADGDSTETVPVDIENEARVQASAVDMGAYEGAVAVPPRPPTAVRTDTVTADSVRLVWAPVNAPDLQSYAVYRSTSPIDSTAGPDRYTPLERVAARDTTLTDTTVEEEKTYYYRVAAVDQRGNASGFSENALARPEAVDVESGLVAYYPFAGTAEDASGNEIDGEASGATLTTDRQGGAESAYRFDGSGDYIQTSSSDSLRVDSALTVAAWIKRSVTDKRALAAQGTTFDTDGNWQLFVSDSLVISRNNSSFRARSDSVLSSGRWHHIAVAFSSGAVTFYVDGDVVSTGELGTSSFNTTRDGLKIGEREYSSASNDFAGKIDQFRLYDRSLSSAEVKQLYEGENASPPPPPKQVSASEGKQRATLSWRSGGDREAGYHVYRSTASFSDPRTATRINDSLLSDTTYVDSTLSVGSTYYYRLTAIGQEGGESNLSKEARVATSPRVTTVRPSAGAPGTAVRIYGAGFAPNPADNTVTFGSATATVDSAHSNVIYATVPGGVRGPVPVSVETSGGAVAAERFSVVTGGDTTFTDQEVGLAGVRRSAAAWGDYNGDGRLDVVVLGNDENGKRTTLYRNDGDGRFSEIDAGLTDVDGGSVAWGDFDGDGDLDLALSGRKSGDTPVTKIYRNDEDSTFTALDAGLTDVWNGAVAWGDYNSDGRLDLAIAGSDEAGSVGNYITTIYRNEGNGSFVESGVGASLDGVTSSSLSWGDYNSDGRLDLAVAGYVGNVAEYSGQRATVIYRNDGGSFTKVGAGLTGADGGSVSWGDYNGDGKLDLGLTGNDGSSTIAKIYRNEGGGTFSSVGAGLTGVSGSSIAWGDHDGDGRLDLAIAGSAGRTSVAKVYRNEGNGAFSALGTGLTGAGAAGAAVSWVDVDGEGALDLLITGEDTSGTPSATVYMNGAQLPRPPTDLAAERFSRRLTLRWNDTTAADAAAYRLYRDTTAIPESADPRALTPIDTVAATQRSYTDSSLALGTTYYYRLTTVDSVGTEGRFSDQLRTSTLDRDDDVVAQYPFDGSAENTRGTGDGSVIGATLTTDRGGTPESAYRFDGTDDYIALSGGDLAGSLTVSLWVRGAGSYGTKRTIIEKPSDWRVGTNGTGLEFRASGSTSDYRVQDTTVAAGQWYHVVGVHDAEASTLRLYLNGTPVDTQTAVTRTRSDSTLVIGADGSVDDGFFAGKVDDVRLYDRPLSPGEVRGLYGEGAPLPPGRVSVRDSTEAVRLAWTGTAAADVSAYRVYRDSVGLDSTAGPRAYTPTATLPPSQTALADTTVTRGQTYRYRVTAVDTAGHESGFSPERAVTVRDRPTLAGIAVDSSESGIPLFKVKASSADTTLTARADSSGAFTLSGPAGTYAVGGQAISDTTYFGHDSTTTSVTLAAGDTARVTLDATTGFHLGLDSVNTTSLFPAPGDTVAVTANYEAWSAERAPGASLYAVSGFFGDAAEAISLGTPGPAPGTGGQLRTALPVPSESGLLSGYLWSFVTYVTASSKAEAKSVYESLYPNLDRLIYTGVVFPDDGVPAPPENLSVTDTTGRVALEWTPPVESDLTQFFVYRSKSPIDSSAGPGALRPYAEVSALDTTFVDTSAAIDSTYHYRVTAGDLLGYESGFSSEAVATVNESDSLTLAGTVRYYGTTTGVGDVTLRLGGNAADTSRTTSDGAFAFDLFARKNYTLSPSRPSDAAPARGITTADLALIRRDVLGTDSLGRYPRLAADADGSSNVSTVDIPLLRRVIQGDAASVPGGLWRFVPTGTDSTKPAFPQRAARRYRDLRADRAGQNFVAIKRGDLDTSWVSTAKSRPAGIPKKSAGRPVVVGLPEREVALQADTITVPVVARAFEDVGGVQFTLEWDPKVLGLVGTAGHRLPGLSANNIGRTGRETKGLATVVWNEPKGRGHSVAAGDSLFALRYRVREEGESDLRVTSAVTPRYAHDGQTLDARQLRGETGAITVEAVPDKFALRANYPNPAHHRTTIEYALPEQAPVTLRLYDVLGRRVATIVNETKEAGRHTAQVQATALSSGVYFYRLRAGDFTKTRRMVIVR